MKRLLILLGLLIAAPAWAGNPSAPPWNNFGASYLGNPNAPSFSGVGAAMDFITMRFTARTLWTACNGNSGDYTWTALDSALTNAITTNGKKVVIDVEFGANVPDCELTKLAALTPNGTYTTTWGFDLVLQQQGVSIVPCDNYVEPLPWNATYQADVERVIDAVKGEVVADGFLSSVVGVVNTMVSTNDDETSQPAGTGTPNGITCPGGGTGSVGALPSDLQCTSACGAAPCTCNGPNDVTGLEAIGYTPSLPANAEKVISDYYHTDFPNAAIHHMVLRNRFPGINSAGTSTGAADLLLTPQAIMKAVGPSLPPGYCEVQVNNMGYSNPTSPNMADAPNVAAGTGCWVGFQSNGQSVNITDAHFTQAASTSFQFNPRFEEWYQTEWADEVSANNNAITWLVNGLKGAALH